MQKTKIFHKIYALAAILLCICFCFIPAAEADSLDAADGDVRQVLTAVAAAAGINMVLDDSVKGSVSVKLADMPPKEMLRIISQSRGYNFSERGGIVYIGGVSADKKLCSVQIDYLDLYRAADMIEMLLNKGATSVNTSSEDAQTKNELSGDYGARQVVINKDDNTLTFFASPQQYEQIKIFLRSMDKAPRQVALEAKVTAIQKDAAKDLGVSWEWSKLPQSPQHDTQYDVVKRTVQNSDGSYSETSDYIPVDNVNRYWQGDGGIPGIIRFGRGPEGYPYEFYYAAQLHALISDGKASILARPNITTIQGNEAVINIGSEVPVPTISTTDSTTTTSIQYREAGIILKCTPCVNEDGVITVKVHTEVSSPLYVEDMKAYRFQKRSADTIVRLKDGETMVIGGLIGSDEARQMSKIPFLGDIPILGNLFKHIKKSKSDSEVMIFLTAREVKL